MSYHNDNTAAETGAVIKRTQRHEEIDQCPQCHLMAWESIQIYGRAPRYLLDGVVDCPECNATVFCKKGTEPGTAEQLEGDHPDSVAQQVRDILAEEQARGQKGGGSSGCKGRKKDPKGGKTFTDEPLEWNANDAEGIVEIKLTRIEMFSCRITLELHEETMKRLEYLARHYKETPSMALRESLRDAFCHVGDPTGIYGVAEPLEDFQDDGKRYEFRLSDVLKEELRATAAANDVTMSQTAEDMVLRHYLRIKEQKDRSRK